MSTPFPGAVSTVADGDTIFSDTIDAIRDRALQVFADTTTRDAAITVPKVGQTCMIQSGTNFGIYVYSGATDGWRQPWNMPWGEVARTRDVTTQSVASTTETVIAAAATTFTAVANRYYRIRAEGSVRMLQAIGTLATTTIRIKDGVTLLEVLTPFWNGGTDYFFAIEAETPLTVGSHTINMTMQSSNAAGISCNGSLVPLVVKVDDIGPVGSPS